MWCGDVWCDVFVVDGKGGLLLTNEHVTMLLSHLQVLILKHAKATRYMLWCVVACRGVSWRVVACRGVSWRGGVEVGGVVVW